MIRFSIIVPLYKGQRYIKDLIQMAEDNLKSMTLANIENEVELILVNDSPDVPLSVDSESNIVKISLYYNTQNSGIHKSKINGLRLSTSDYVLFLDQDDYISNDFLLKQFNVMQEANADVVVGNALNEIDKKNSVVSYRTKGQFKNVKDIEAYIVSRNQIISMGQCLIKRSSIPEEWGEYILTRNGSDDLFLWLLMLTLDKKVALCKDVVYTHKYTGENLSAAVDKMTNSSVEVGQFLQQISYVPKHISEEFLKSRKLQQDFLSADLFAKVLLILKNPRMFIRRAKIKFRTFF